MAARILLLEDDPAIAGTVVFALQREGWSVDHVLLVGAARASVAASRPALVILDVGLPDGSGLELCREWRQAGAPALLSLPVLMLTARSEEFDRVLGLELGADDYLSKPFSPRELVARVRALLRRAALTPQAVPMTAAALFELDPDGQRIRFAGQRLALTRLEFGLLGALLRAPGRIRSRESLLDEVWGLDGDATDRTVDTHVKTLRAKLRAVRPELEPIATHRGMGYSLELPG